MPKGVMLTPEQQAQRREDIVDIALHLFDEHGFQKTSLREIAFAAKMGKSSLYDFFRTKDEIMVYAAERAILSATESALKIVAAEPLPEQCLHKLMNELLYFAVQNKSIYMWLLTEAAHLDEEYQKRLETVRHTYRDVIQSVITDGITKGIFHATNPALAARLLINSMLSITFVSDFPASLETMLEETIRIFLFGIKTKGISE